MQSGCRQLVRFAAPAAVVAAALGGCGSERDSDTAERPSDRAERPDQLAAPTAERDAARPVRLEVPAIDVTAPIIPLDLKADRTLEVPSDYGDTGWWRAGPEPGERGAAVIVGHIDSKTGPAVFYRLDDLESDDEVRVVREDGTAVRFKVTGKERHAKQEFPTARVYGRTNRPALRLVTCSGDFDDDSGHYVDNTIVFLRRE